MGTPGCVIDQIIFKQLLGVRLGLLYERAEAVFQAYKSKEPLLSYYVADLLLRAYKTGQSEEALRALEAEVANVVEYRGNHRTTPNGTVVDRIVKRLKLA